MRNHIEVVDLMQLSNERILKLSNMLGTTWEFWEKPEHVQDARSAYVQDGLVHNTIKKTAQRCSVGKMIDILSRSYMLDIKNEFVENIVTWKLQVCTKDGEFKGFHGKADLCDGLWMAMLALEIPVDVVRDMGSQLSFED